VPDSLVEAAGAVVATSCSTDAAGDPYTELILGFGVTGPGGGGWQGVDVAYTVGDAHYTLTTGYAFLICGTDVTCDPAGPASSP
jgi:hypothetical protein